MSGTARERILYCIAVYDNSQLIYTRTMLDGARDMCEAGFRLRVVLLTAHPELLTPLDDLKAALSCANRDGALELELAVRPPATKKALTLEHRRLMWDRLDAHDLFIYAEDDIGLTLAHLSAWLSETRRLATRRYMVGFMRYERALLFGPTLNGRGGIAYDAGRLQHGARSERVVWEHAPASLHVLRLGGELYYQPETVHHGMWIANRKQLLSIQSRCHQLMTRPCDVERYSRGRERLFAAGELYSCGASSMVIPVERVASHLVHHLPDKNWYSRSRGRCLWAEESLLSHSRRVVERCKGPAPGACVEQRRYQRLVPGPNRTFDCAAAGLTPVAEYTNGSMPGPQGNPPRPSARRSG